MKVLAFGFYDDFSRFFLGIEKDLNILSNKNEFLYISSHLSGILPVLGKKNIYCLQLEYWKSFLSRKHKEACEINLDTFLDFHRQDKDFESKRDKLLDATCFYLNFLEHKVTKFKPDVMIISGDSRIPARVLKYLGEKLNIKMFFFEQGPYGTTMLDTIGVNANSSVRIDWIGDNTNSEGIVDKVRDFMTRSRESKYSRNPIFRSIDLIMNIWPLRKFLLVDLRERSIISMLFAKLSRKQEVALESLEPSGKKRILLALQVPQDANLILHSPNFSNHLEILKACLYAIDKSSTELIIREHPLFKGAYESELYKIIERNTHIKLDTGRTVENAVLEADCVIVNNSMLGVEAMLYKKPIVCLGDSYYKEALIGVSNQDELKDVLNSSIEVDMNKRLSFLNFLLFNYLIPGHFRDNDLKPLTQNIALKISKGFQ